MISSRSVPPACGLALLLAIGTAIGTLPVLRSTADMLDEQERLRGEIALMRDGAEVVDRLREKVALLNELGAGRLTPIPPENDMAELIRTLSETMDSAGLRDRDISLQNSKQLDEASVLPISVRAGGSFDEVREVIRDVESMPRLVRVGRMRLRIEGGVRGEVIRHGELDAELLVEAFYGPGREGEAK
ncbi:MAG: type 4a pilus biogenesis protein PilO [Planctomycetota bacterium]